jgi:hypothetical protein
MSKIEVVISCLPVMIMLQNVKVAEINDFYWIGV